MRVARVHGYFLRSKELVFVVEEGMESAHFNVESLDLLFGALELIPLVNGQLRRWRCPQLQVDGLSGVAEEVEIGEEGIGDDLVPVEQLPWWVHFHRCNVVFVERGADGVGSCLQRSADMLAHTVTYRTMYLVSQ